MRQFRSDCGTNVFAASKELGVTMKTGGFSCGKESLLQEVIHSEKLKWSSS